MSKSTKFIAAFGIVAGLGIAALPIASASADTSDVEVSVSVDSAISLAMSGTTSISALAPNAADLTTMSSTATVSTNDLDGYTLTVIDKDTVTALTNANSDTIPAATATPTAGTAGWGVQTSEAYTGMDTGLNTAWTAMPASTGTALTLKNTGTQTAATSADTTVLKYGVATAAAQPTGTYTDTIVFTATAN